MASSLTSGGGKKAAKQQTRRCFWCSAINCRSPPRQYAIFRRRWRHAAPPCRRDERCSSAEHRPDENRQHVLAVPARPDPVQAEHQGAERHHRERCSKPAELLIDSNAGDYNHTDRPDKHANPEKHAKRRELPTALQMSGRKPRHGPAALWTLNLIAAAGARQVIVAERTWHGRRVRVILR